ncbi:chitotriosidase-1-like [Venturia canescens]|uniref:chitotriosidase-1-like n=1 Tax=Venturia canescens TaxID=32260 RepID=UPI001C9C753C|nr:chitotriosidase-1-like [Venturia canescens]
MCWLSWMAAVCLAGMATAAADKKIVCYFESSSVHSPGAGRFTIDNIDSSLCTHYIYAYVGLNKSRIEIIDPWQDLPIEGGQNGFERFNDMRRKNPGVKTLVAIGGANEGSVEYSKMAETLYSREIFVNNTVEFVKKYGFDGFDLVWQWPNQRGGKREDVLNFVKLIKELRTAFDKENLLLSAGLIGAKLWASDSYHIGEISKYLHFINLLAFRFHGYWDYQTGLNAPLYRGSTDIGKYKELNVHDSIKYWLSEGAPIEKLVLGIPLYGQSFTLNDSNVNDIGAPSVGPGIYRPYSREPGVLGYNEICEMQQQTHWVFKYDQERRAPYLYWKDQWIGYDNVKSVREKAGYVNKMGLGGVVIWTIDKDDFRGNCDEKYPLIRSIKHVLRNRLEE